VAVEVAAIHDLATAPLKTGSGKHTVKTLSIIAEPVAVV